MRPLVKALFPVSLFFIFAVYVSCRHERQIVPYDVDSDEIFKPLQPNEEDLPEDNTFGQDSIPGFTLDYEISSDYNDVYIYFSNLTLLEVNPSITQSLFNFAQQQLIEYGFTNDSVSFKPNEFDDLLAQGLSYRESTDKVLENISSVFKDKLSDYTYLGPFNISFMIYPVYLDKNYITYRESCYCYTGGAHGMTISYLHTYSLESGKLLTLNEIVKPSETEKVREEVAAQMAYSYPIYENIHTVQQYIDSLNVWLDNFATDVNPEDEITLKNFPLPDPAITNEGLVFIYQMYELTPGSDGCPIVVVPYKDIKGCLFESFPR